jgi:hypothetical protein
MNTPQERGAAWFGAAFQAWAKAFLLLLYAFEGGAAGSLVVEWYITPPAEGAFIVYA